MDKNEVRSSLVSTGDALLEITSQAVGTNFVKLSTCSNQNLFSNYLANFENHIRGAMLLS